MTLFENMLSQYDIRDNRATYEVMQKIALAGLHRGGFFHQAAFYGGTCLRIFHGLNRFSEDMDFTLMAPNPEFRFEDYFPVIVSEFESAGRQVTITKKDKRTFGKVESAFLKDNTDVYNLAFQTEKSPKIKIKVDTQPPLRFEVEQKLLLHPYSFMVRTLTLPCLFAGKMHAIVFRNWKHRVKGRDWYDFEWYVRQSIPLDYNHLQERIRQFNGVEMNREEFLRALRERIEGTDINQVKADVVPFVLNSRDLDIWSTEYFLQLVNMMKIQ